MEDLAAHALVVDILAVNADEDLAVDGIAPVAHHFAVGQNCLAAAVVPVAGKLAAGFADEDLAATGKVDTGFASGMASAHRFAVVAMAAAPDFAVLAANRLVDQSIVEALGHAGQLLGWFPVAAGGSLQATDGHRQTLSVVAGLPVGTLGLQMRRC